MIIVAVVLVIIFDVKLEQLKSFIHMAIHHPYQRHFICPPGAKLTDASSLLLQEGQIGIYDVEGEQDENGLKALTSFAGCPKDEQRYVIRVGVHDKVKSRDSNDKNYSTPSFALNEIIDVYASAPKKIEISVDEVIFGYNGIDDSTAIKANKGDRIPVKIKLSGRPFELLGYPYGEVVIEDYIIIEGCPGLPGACDEECNPCETVDLLPAILSFIERVKSQPIAGGGHVGDYVEITPIHSCTNEPEKTIVEENMNFYCLEACDTGDAYALMLLKAQYPGLDIKRVDRKLSMTKYQVMKKGAVPDPYKQTLASILKGCDECPSGTSEVKGGYIYTVILPDEGADLSGSLSSLGTGKKVGQDKSDGMYVVTAAKKLTKDAIDAFVEDNPTSTVTFVSKVNSMCSNADVTSIDWSACGSCKVSKEAYMITLPDDECGNSALAELQEAFPNMNIKDYGTPGGCQHSFKGEVYTNMVCDDCDPIFRDFYVSKAPEGYRGRNWKRLGAVATDGTVVDPLPKLCKCGVKFKAIDYMVAPFDCLLDKMVFEEGSVRISVQGGYPDEQREAISTYFTPIHTEYKSHWAPRTHVGYELLGFEKEQRQYFDFRTTHGKYMERVFTNEETRIDLLSQYADFSVTIQPRFYSNGFGRKMDDPITYHFHVPYGQHEGVQELMDLLASAAGIKPCKI